MKTFLSFIAALPILFHAEISLAQESALDLAHHYIQQSAQHPEVKQDAALSETLTQLNLFFNKKIKIKVEDGFRCRNKMAWVKPGTGYRHQVTIHVCKSLLKFSDEEVAQTLIHELTHLVFETTEFEATRLEVLITYYGGGSPTWCPYLQQWKFDYTPNAKWFTNEFLKRIGVQIPQDYAAWLWSALARGYLSFEKLKAEHARLKIYFNESELLEILNHADSLGNTPLMMAAREGNLERATYLLTLPGIQKHAKNNDGKTACDFAKERKQPGSDLELLLCP